MKTNIILNGDALQHLKELPSESINCVMTSPPYWALRDYGVDGQIGLEKTFDEFINNLCGIFDEVKRVLRKDGTCWVNLGDTYSGNKEGKTDKKVSDHLKGQTKNLHKKVSGGIPEKSLCMIPFRFSIEMVKRGWILRNTIIWHKPNCMPTSVKDRFTVDFEYLFFFVKMKRYWFEQQRTKTKENSLQRLKRGFTDASSFDWKDRKVTKEDRNRIRSRGIKEGFKYEKSYNNSEGSNMTTVRKFPTQSFPEAHFAVYPEAICEIPIKAGCPEGGIVLDPFFGAGTTGIVALKQNKQFIGIELNPDYIKIADERLKPFLEQTKLLDYS